MPSYRGSLTTKVPDEVYPAPYVAARVEWRGSAHELPALIDSGADQSGIPRLTAEQLGLQKIDEVDVEDINGGSVPSDVFVVNLEFNGFTVSSLPVAGINYPVMVIGRDVLSDLVLEMDGPAQTFMLRD